MARRTRRHLALDAGDGAGAQALLAGTAAPAGDDERRFTVAVGGHTEQVTIPADQAEVLRQLDLSPHLAAGVNRVRLEERTKTGAGYQVVFRYHVPEVKKPAAQSLWRSASTTTVPSWRSATW
ncbi:MAG: hypothetical protein U0736_26465 [Gemmataceae bacterium]